MRKVDRDLFHLSKVIFFHLPYKIRFSLFGSMMKSVKKLRTIGSKISSYLSVDVIIILILIHIHSQEVKNENSINDFFYLNHDGAND